jgi:hypothetical protein
MFKIIIAFFKRMVWSSGFQKNSMLLNKYRADLYVCSSNKNINKRELDVVKLLHLTFYNQQTSSRGISPVFTVHSYVPLLMFNIAPMNTERFRK